MKETFFQDFSAGGAGRRCAASLKSARKHSGIRWEGLAFVPYQAVYRRRLVLPRRIANWPMTSLQQRLVKTAVRLIKHARYYLLLLAESYLTRRLFGAMLGRIAALPLPAG